MLTLNSLNKSNIKILGLALFLAAGFLVLFVVTSMVWASSNNVSGTLTTDTTWTPSGSPYVVTSELIIQSDVTLTIEPGVEVQFQPETRISVNGKLIARGTADSTISFTSATKDASVTFWGDSADASYTAGGIYIGGSIIERADFNGVSVNADTAAPYLHQLNVKEAKVYAERGGIRVHDSTFTDSPLGGVVLDDVNNALVEKNRFINSKIKGSGSSSATIDGNDLYRSFGIATKDTAFPVPLVYNYVIKNNVLREDYRGIEAAVMADEGYAATTTVENNLVYRFSQAGYNPIVAFAGNGPIYGQAAVVVRNNIVAENTINNPSVGSRVGGIRTTTDKGLAGTVNIYVQNNTVANNGLNTTTATAAGSFGILADGDYGTFSYNTVVGNDTTDVSRPGYGGLAQKDKGPEPTPWWTNNNFDHNNVFGNKLRNGTTDLYGLYNEENSTITATGNYWGTTDTVSVGDLIFDRTDSGELGLAVYEPFLNRPDDQAPVPPPLNFKTASTDGELHLSWNRVDASDTAGYKVYYDTDNSAFPYEGVDSSVGASPISVVGDVTSTVLTGLDPGKTYYVAVTAIDNDYNSGLSTLANQLAGHESWYSRLVAAAPWPIADFYVAVSDTTAQVGELIAFHDASLGTVTGWDWDFGDGTTSTATNPTHTYTSQNFFTVTLTVTGPAGQDTEVKYRYIETGKPPETTMTLDPAIPNGDNNWYNGNRPLVSLRPDETATVRWRWDNTGSWSFKSNVPPTADATFTAPEGQHTLSYYSFDSANSTETTKTSDPIKVDTLAPTDPSVSSPSHTVNGWSTDKTIDISFTGATDTAGSGVDGFSYAWSQVAVFPPDPVKNAEGYENALTSGALSEGPWYFHLRTKDNAGNWTSTVHKGPYGIDTIAPTGTIAINGGAAKINTTLAKLDLTCDDGAGSGPDKARFKNDGGSWGIWQNYSASPYWTLATGDGEKKVWAQFKDKAGNLSPELSDTIILDKTAPTMTLAAPPFSTKSSKTKTFKVGWTSTSAGDVVYNVQYKIGKAGTWTDWQAKTTATAGYFKGEAGKTYYFKGKATDSAGNASPWTLVKKTIVPYDQNSLIAKRNGFGGSIKNTKTGYYLGTARYSKTAGDEITYAFTGDSLALITDKGATRGAADVYVDGKLRKTVDTYAKATRYRKVVASFQFYKTGKHTVRIVNKGTPGRPRFTLDALAVGR